MLYSSIPLDGIFSRKCVFRAKLVALNRVFLQKLPHVASPHFSHGGILDKLYTVDKHSASVFHFSIC